MDLFELVDLSTLAQADIPTAAATLARSLAEAAVRAEVEQLLDYVADDTVTLDGSGHGVLLLPELPVHAVAAVEVDGTALEESGWQLRRAGVLVRPGGWIWRYGVPVTVTYTHGYQVPPPAARAVALAVALRLVQNPGRLSAATIGAVNLSYGAAAAAGAELLEAERRQLDGLRVGER